MNVHATTVDVVIVGGGPAGGATAIWLAQGGFEVVLLDRAEFPRDKACGEFLTPQAARLLATLGVWDSLCTAGVRDVMATLLVAPDGTQARHAPLAGGVAGYALRRVTLDTILVQKAREAGVQVRERFAVRTVCQEQGRVTGVIGKDEHGETVTIGARLVIGADGTHSLVARQLGLVRALPRLQRVALVTHFRNVSGACDAIEMRTHGPIVCGMGFPATSATDPTPCANVTLVAPTTQAEEIAGRAGEYVAQTLAEGFPDLAERLRGAVREPKVRTVGCFGHTGRPYVADGAMLVGDAATFIDPFTGEGVYFGLRGAQLAAETATDALQSGDTSRRTLLAYAGARRELSERYLLLNMVQAVVRTPSLLNQMVRRLERFPGAADRLLAILGDTRPPRDVLHPGMLWRLFAPGI